MKNHIKMKNPTRFDFDAGAPKEYLMSAAEELAQWNELKRKIKLRWSRFTESEIELFKDNLELITENIKKSYGSSNAKAEQEYQDFKKSLDAATKAIEALKELAKNQLN